MADRTTEEHALPETFEPERGELFVEETPKPFALSLREILEEYRSDSSPSRYAMAVELGEADDWELYQGPKARTEPLYPVNGAAMQSLLHDSWSGRENPLREPPAQEWDWMDIISEYSGESAQESAPPPVQREQPLMTKIEEQDREPFAAGEEPEEALPAGFYALRERHVEQPPVSTYLTVEEILAEFRSEGAPEAASAPIRPAPLPEAEMEPPEEPQSEPESEPEPPHRARGRRAGLEAEARSLFGAFRRGSRPEPPEEEDAEEDTSAPESASETEPAPPTEHTGEEAEYEPEDEPEALEDEPEESEDEAEDEPETRRVTRFDLLRERFRNRPRRKTAARGDEEEELLLSELRDEDASPGRYAEDGEYESEEAPAESFPSFGEYLLGLVAGLWVRLRGVRPPAAARHDTAEAEEEEPLGDELPFRNAARYYSRHTNPLRLRCRLSVALWVVMAYLTLGIPATGLLRSISVTAQMLLGLQLGVMLLALDVVVGAGSNLRRLRFGADGLAVLCCLLTSLDALGVAFSLFGTPHVPLCLFSSLSLIGVLFASLYAASGLTASLAVPVEAHSRAMTVYSVTAETGLTENSATLIESLRPVSGFLRRSEEAPVDETAYNRAAPLLLALAFVLSLALVIVKKSGSNFLFVWSALLAPVIPFTALLSFALPFKLGAESIAVGPRKRPGEEEFEREEGEENRESEANKQGEANKEGETTSAERARSCGAAIAGWSGLAEIGGCRNLIVTDRDLFPDDAVTLEGALIFADADDARVISYAGTMMSASGCGLAPLFVDLMERNGFRPSQLESFEFHAASGLVGQIDGHTVYCGTGEFMELMKVKIPIDTLERRKIRKTAVMLAIDGMIYGIFSIRYRASHRVKRALVRLMRSNRHPVFATRDFNIGSELLAEVFHLKTEGYDFPPYLERVRLSKGEPAEGRKVSALLCGEGLGKLVHMADTGRRMYFVVWTNLIVSLLSSVFGLFAVFLLLYLNGSISIAALFLYALFWIIPVALFSQFVKI